MCGILGTVGFGRLNKNILDVMAHRGPDGSGEYFDLENEVWLGHRRLSIIDLSNAGRQPMASPDGQQMMTYNGEVYNFKMLKSAFFAGEKFTSETDSEVILACYRRFGQRTPEHLRGMFALGILDKSRDELFLCRDRLGVKPLYYYQKDGRFAFASELAALKKLPGVDLTPDPIGLDHYFSTGCIPAPFSAYKFIKKLRPGWRLVYDLRRREIKAHEPYWSLREKIDSSRFSSEKEWIAAIEEKITEAVKLRMISDVPLGAFLSGGIDSSLVVSTMAQLSDRPVKTFTIGFDEKAYDERPFAQAVAQQYGADHHVEIVKPDAAGILPKLVQSFGEPFGDSSAIPTYYVSQIARQGVTVALSGDGGDEVFAGYERYARMYRYLFLNGVPMPVRKLVQLAGKRMPMHWKGYGFLQRQAFSGTELYTIMNQGFDARLKSRLYTKSFQDELAKAQTGQNEQILDTVENLDDALITQLQYIDLNGYLPDDILTKVDRTSMLHSLEARVPLLDHEVVELGFSCPASIRFKNNTLKHVTKSILRRRVSDEVVNHEKMGFGVPLDKWIKGDLKQHFSTELSKNDDRLHVVERAFADEIFQGHLKNGRDFSGKLYWILMYKLWRNQD